MPPGLTRGLGIGLQEGLADCGGDHGVLALRHVRQSVAHPMNSASLPGRTEHTGDRVTQTLVSVGDDQLDALETALDQALEESRPERFGFGRASANRRSISRRPSVVTATAIIAATETMRPPSRTLR